MVRRTKKQKAGRCDWPPKELLLPDLATLERLSLPAAGQRQGELFPTADQADSREARLRRLVGIVPGVTTADRLGAKP